MAKSYQDLLKKIEKDGIKTDEFVRLFSKLGEFNLTDSKVALDTVTQILEMSIRNDWEFKVPGLGVMKKTEFKGGKKMIATAGGKGEKSLVEKIVKRSERWYFALSENIVNQARIRLREEENN